MFFKYKGESEELDFLYQCDEHIKRVRFIVEDTATGKETKVPVKVSQLEGGADLSDIKGFEPLYSVFMDKIDAHLNEQYSYYELLGWCKDPEWKWAVNFGVEAVVDVAANQDPVYSIEPVDEGYGSLRFTCWLRSRKGEKATKHFSLRLEDLGLKARAKIDFDLDSMRSYLDSVYNGEGRIGREVFLEALSRLGPESDLSLLSDFGKAKFAQAISKTHDHEITSVDEAYEKIKNLNVYLSTDTLSDTKYNLHDEY